MPSQTIIPGDCLNVFKDLLFKLQVIVADPPAGIGFMGRKWDKHSPHAAYQPPIPPRSKKHLRELQERHAFVIYWAARFAAAYDACEDDATALIWALPRTSDWTAEALRLAGWAIVDVITHHFGQGWPKGPNLLKPGSEHWILAKKGELNIDVDACRIERGESTAKRDKGTLGYAGGTRGEPRINGGREGGAWPANVLLSHAESCVCVGVRKVKASGTKDNTGKPHHQKLMTHGTSNNRPRDDVWKSLGDASGLESVPAYHCAVACDCGRSWTAEAGCDAPRCECGAPGWWACPVAEMDAQSGLLKSGARNEGVRKSGHWNSARGDGGPAIESSEGGASRFFTRFGYYGKAPSGEKHAGCEGLYWRRNDKAAFGFDRIEKAEWEKIPFEPPHAFENTLTRRTPHRAEGNVHPTVKSIALMRWLHALTGAKRIGDLCAGSGSGAIAAYLDGIEWIGAEVCPEAIEIAEARLAFWRGCTPDALARFCEAGEVPQRPKTDPRQVSMFGE